MYRVNITAVAPALITTQPTIKLEVILDKGEGTMTTTRNTTINPTPGDTAPSGFYIDENSAKHTLSDFLSALTTFRMKAVVGDVFFNIPLLPGERFSIGSITVS